MSNPTTTNVSPRLTSDVQVSKNKLLDVKEPIVVDEKYVENIPRRSSKPLNIKMYDS